ncbi:MAG: hypothetical protein AB7P03_26635 [Kofleriaceae bacterium]
MLSGVNAVAILVERLSPPAVRRLAALRTHRFERFDPFDRLDRAGEPRRPALDNAEAAERVRARWAGDLCGVLNAMTRGELWELATTVGVMSAQRSPALREALWAWGAELERGGATVSPALQPRPVLLGGHLVIQSPPRGMFPALGRAPRIVPPPVAAAPPSHEPETLDELLAAADRAIGVRLGPRGRDKGAWGNRAAQLLGVTERGIDEPDWRGDVEIKTVPVACEPSGRWRVVEDPAIAMVNERGLAKLQRTLWLVRASLDAHHDGSGDPDATIISWYLLDWDDEIARLVRRYLHQRPKGPAGTQQRGLYLHKRFFADAGLLATLNGSPELP